jgi:hypothetical protein
MKFFIKLSGNNAKSYEISESKIFDYALNKIGDGGMTAEGTAEALAWVSLVRSAREDYPITVACGAHDTLLIYSTGGLDGGLKLEETSTTN